MKGIMAALPYTLFFFVAVLIILTYFFLNSQEDVRMKDYKQYKDLFDFEYDGGFEDIFQFFPHSDVKKLRETTDDESARDSG